MHTTLNNLFVGHRIFDKRTGLAGVFNGWTVNIRKGIQFRYARMKAPGRPQMKIPERHLGRMIQPNQVVQKLRRNMARAKLESR